MNRRKWLGTIFLSPGAAVLAYIGSVAKNPAEAQTVDIKPINMRAFTMSQIAIKSGIVHGRMMPYDKSLPEAKQDNQMHFFFEPRNGEKEVEISRDQAISICPWMFS